MTLLATLICAPLLILGTALVFAVLVMTDRPDFHRPASPAAPSQEWRRAA